MFIPLYYADGFNFDTKKTPVRQQNFNANSMVIFYDSFI